MAVGDSSSRPFSKEITIESYFELSSKVKISYPLGGADADPKTEENQKENF